MKKTLAILIILIFICINTKTIFAEDGLNEFDVSSSLQVNEGDCCLIVVKDNDTKNPVDNATVSVLVDQEVVKSNTTSEGKSYFCAYEVTENQTYQVNISKEGYATYSFNLSVIDITKLFLNISGKQGSPGTYEEEVIITVTDDYGNLVDGANVSIIKQSGKVVTTNKMSTNGKVTFSIQESLNESIIPSPYYKYIIYAELEGYKDSSVVEINLTDKTNSSPQDNYYLVFVLLFILIIIGLVLWFIKNKKKKT